MTVLLLPNIDSWSEALGYVVGQALGVAIVYGLMKWKRWL